MTRMLSLIHISDDDNPLSLKVDFILSFCDIVVGSKEGLKPVRCV